jgi:hypothetical protein
VVVVVAVVLCAGHDEPSRPRAPAAIDPLAFMPEHAQAVFDLDTGVPGIAVLAAELVPRLPGATRRRSRCSRWSAGGWRSRSRTGSCGWPR